MYLDMADNDELSDESKVAILAVITAYASQLFNRCRFITDQSALLIHKHHEFVYIRHFRSDGELHCKQQQVGVAEVNVDRLPHQNLVGRAVRRG